jgi:hypothetical protein
MSKRLHVKYPLFLSDFSEIWIFSTDIRKKAYLPNLMKICFVRAELFHVDRQTGMLFFSKYWNNYIEKWYDEKL